MGSARFNGVGRSRSRRRCGLQTRTNPTSCTFADALPAISMPVCPATAEIPKAMASAWKLWFCGTAHQELAENTLAAGCRSGADRASPNLAMRVGRGGGAIAAVAGVGQRTGKGLLSNRLAARSGDRAGASMSLPARPLPDARLARPFGALITQFTPQPISRGCLYPQDSLPSPVPYRFCASKRSLLGNQVR